ncbi:MAG: 4Fe-4S binding protein [Bacillota bacterium]|nr:4Fe-4S binding protein [Bacillota bacterium]
MPIRKIVRIDEEKCNGCGLCVTPCAEGAIQIVDGKARVVREELCDGAGFCLTVCPTGALSIEEREAREFSRGAAGQHATSQLQSESQPQVHMQPQPEPELQAHMQPQPQLPPQTRGQAQLQPQPQLRPQAHITQGCFLCGAREGAEVLIPCRFKGDSLWVCVRCLPRVIHG